MKCVDCPYFWAEYNGVVPQCHYRWNDGSAPCEIMDGCAEPAEAEVVDDDECNS